MDKLRRLEESTSRRTSKVERGWRTGPSLDSASSAASQLPSSSLCPPAPISRRTTPSSAD